MNSCEELDVRRELLIAVQKLLSLPPAVFPELDQTREVSSLEDPVPRDHVLFSRTSHT